MKSMRAQVLEEASRYAELGEQVSRTASRARVLHLLDELELPRPEVLRVWRVDADELARDGVLRGAFVMHLDLVFRSSVSAVEARHSAAHGLALAAEHPELPGFPVAVALCAVGDRLAERRGDLFEVPARGFPGADVVMPYALAASPRGLGAGRRLLVELIRMCGGQEPPPRVTTFSPLTGLRAHVIRCVDDASEWARVAAAVEGDARPLREQLLELLAHGLLPAAIQEPARGWLRREAMAFAQSDRYHVGNFHRGMGASLAGVLEDADPSDSDALWWRAWFDYGRASAAYGG